MTNYRELLKSYMDHVIMEEGTTFIPHPNDPTHFLKQEEVKELIKIHQEIEPEHKLDEAQKQLIGEK